MSEGQRPVGFLTLVIGGIVGIVMALKSQNLQALATSLLEFHGIWKIIALLLALVNLKNLPLVWHVSLSL